MGGIIAIKFLYIAKKNMYSLITLFYLPTVFMLLLERKAREVFFPGGHKMMSRCYYGSSRQPPERSQKGQASDLEEVTWTHQWVFG